MLQVLDSSPMRVEISDMAGLITDAMHLLGKVDQQLCLWSWYEHSRPYCKDQIPPMRRPCEVLQGHSAWAVWHCVSMPSS